MAPETHSPQSRTANIGHSPSSARPVLRGVFRKEGEYWTVGYVGKALRLRDSKGLGYLAHLIRHPGVEFHVLDLAGGIAGHREEDEPIQTGRGLPQGDEELEKAGLHVANIGDAGELLDDQAKVAYRRRLSELREELEEAKELGKVERAERVEQEIDSLTRELSRAVGLGGRSRRAASASERARQTITKTIKAVLERIAQSDAALSELLSRCVKTGTFCSYQIDNEFPIAWEFGALSEEPSEQTASRGDPVAEREDDPSSEAASLAVLEVSPFSVAARTGFVGRENEHAAIRTVIDRALSGRGSIVMLGGGPGVGKSRLAMEMGEYATRLGFACAVGHCYERDEPYPYLPFVEILEARLAQAPSRDDFRRRMGDSAAELAQIAPSLRRVFPDIPQPMELPPAQKRRYLFQSVSEGLRRASQTRSLLYILEDLHWADESTLGLLIHLANRITQLPIVLIGTYRDGYSENNPAFVRTLEELIRMGNRPLKLGGLSRNAIAEMLNGLSQRRPPENLVSLIFEESQGYPFFVEEVYRHLIEEGKVFDESGEFRSDIKINEIDVPENVRLIIGRRLERLDDNEIRTLAVAAIIGRSFSFRLLAEISQTDVDEIFAVIEKAQQMGIIVPSSQGPEKPFTFTHELVRQTLLGRIAAPRMQQLHAAVADAIEAVYPDAIDEHAAEIVDHLLKAGSFANSQRLVRYLTIAGKRALEAAAFDEARRSFRAALSHPAGLEPRERAGLLASLAMAELSLEQWDAALANLREALDIYTKLDDREMIGKSFSELTDAFIWVGRFREAAETAHRGLAYLGTEVSVNRARLLASLGQALASAAQGDAACEALREALNIASQLSNQALEARVLGARSIVHLHFFRLKEAAADGLLSEQLGASQTPPWQRGLQLRILHQTLLYLGRLEEALKVADQLEPLAIKIGQAYSVALCASTRAWVEFGKAPDLDKLEAGFQQASKSEQKVRFPFWDVLTEVELSLVEYIRGNWDAAIVRARAACRRDHVTSSIGGYGEGVLFRQMAYAGDRVGALAVLQQNRRWLPVSGGQNLRGSWWMLALVIEGLAMLGEHSQAGELYPLVLELLDTGGISLWPVSRLTQTSAGIAAAAAHNWKAAEEHFEIAVRQAEAFPQRLELAEIRRFHAMMLIDRAARGDREKAQALLKEALDSYTQIGMPRHLQMTRALLS